MDIFQHRLRPHLTLLLLAIVTGFMSGRVMAQDTGTQPEELPTWFMFEGEKSFKQAIMLYAPRAFKVTVYGGETLTVTGNIRANDFSRSLEILEDRYNLLLVARGNSSFEIYCDDAEKDPKLVGSPEKTENFSYVYNCRQSRAADLVNLLLQKGPLGFPKANALTGTATAPFKEFFTQHNPALPADAQTGNLTTGGELGKGTKFQLTLDNGILVTGPLKEVRAAVQKLRLLDRPTRVVLIEVLIVQYFHDDQFSWRYNLKDGALLKADPPAFSAGTTPPDTLTPGTNKYGPQPWGIDFQNLAFDPASGATSLAYSGIGSLTSQFKQNLTFLVSEDLARIVTNPHIAVVNGQSGQILLNEKFNFLNAVTVPTGTVSQQADALNSMTSINVTPTIVGPNRVHVAVNTILSTFTGVSNVQSSLPGQRINELGTSVILDNRQSLILGGLVKEEIVDGRSKIPGLAKIPVIGHLFRGKNQIRRFSETVVYIIPELNEPEQPVHTYRDRVFEYSDEQMAVGEEIRARHRMEKYDSDRRFYQNEQIDEIERRNLHQEMRPGPNRMHRDGYPGQPAEIISPGAPVILNRWKP